MAFIYSVDEHGFLKTSFRLTHTIWQHILCAGSMWLFLVLHVAFWYANREGILEEYGFSTAEGGNAHLSWQDVRTVSAVTVFFEVFYTQQCYARYLEMNTAINQAFRCTHRFCFDLKNFTIGVQPQYSRCIFRWTRAHLVMFFMELKHGPVDTEEFAKLMQVGLLKPMEASFLQAYSGAQRGMIMLDWIARGSVMAIHDSAIRGPTIYNAILTRILMVDEAQKKVLDVVRMPVPFQYFHLLNMMICVNVLCWAFCMGMTPSFFSPVIFFFTASIYLGMLELAKLFSDPFGEDEVDFPIHIWLEKFLENNIAFVDYSNNWVLEDLREAINSEELTHYDLQGVSSLIKGSTPEPFFDEEVFPDRCPVRKRSYVPGVNESGPTLSINSITGRLSRGSYALVRNGCPEEDS